MTTRVWTVGGAAVVFRLQLCCRRRAEWCGRVDVTIQPVVC
jgi:hypothetical protein